MNVSQGWIPQNETLILKYANRPMAAELVSYLRTKDHLGQEEQARTAGTDETTLASRAIASVAQRSTLSDSRWSHRVDIDPVFRNVSDDNPDDHKRVRDWVWTEENVKDVERSVRNMRKELHGVCCMFDHGWEPSPSSRPG